MAHESSGCVPASNLVLFACLMGAAVVATAAMVPALLFLLDPARPTLLADPSVGPMPLVIGFCIGNVFLSAVAIAVGLRLEPTVRMGVPLIRSWLSSEETVSPPISAALVRCSGLAFALATIVLATGLAFRSQLPELPEDFMFPPIWQGILMMLGGAVREEIFFRLCAMNLFVWIAMKVLRNQEPARAMAWSSNVLVALIFAWMHLIPAGQILALNPIVISVAIALATLAGILFGGVYWRHGLVMAVFTHATCSLLVYLGGRGIMAFAS